MKKVLITGINGLLGQNLVKEFIPDHEVFGIDLGPSIFGSSTPVSVTALDLTENAAVANHISALSPDYVIHGAAYTNVDGAESNADLAFKVNAQVPESLAMICKSADIPFIHISTDYVFSGSNGPYSEQDACEPRGIYAESKYAGEQAVLNTGGRLAVIRPNVLYGHGKELKSSFVEWLLKELRNERPVNIVDDQYNNPTYARRLAGVIRVILEQQAWDIWHFGSKEVVSRYTFSLKIADTFGLSSQLIHAISTAELNQKAPRPLRSGLVCEKVNHKLGVPILSIDEELALLKEEIHAT